GSAAGPRDRPQVGEGRRGPRGPVAEQGDPHPRPAAQPGALISPPVGVALPGSAGASEVKQLAAQAEASGASAVWLLDVRRDPFLMSAAAAEATEHATVGTNVAVAFPRSP